LNQKKYSSKLCKCLSLIEKLYFSYLIFENLIPVHIMCSDLLRKLDLPLRLPPPHTPWLLIYLFLFCISIIFEQVIQHNLRAFLGWMGIWVWFCLLLLVLHPALYLCLRALAPPSHSSEDEDLLDYWVGSAGLLAVLVFGCCFPVVGCVVDCLLLCGYSFLVWWIFVQVYWLVYDS
jgi:hypothetical protein